MNAPRADLAGLARLQALDALQEARLLNVRRRQQLEELPDVVSEQLSDLESSQRTQIVKEETEEVNVAQWALKALQAERIFTFRSRMRALELGLPVSDPSQAAGEEDYQAVAADSRQRSLAAVVLHRLLEPNVRRREQLADVFRGTGGLCCGDRSEQYQRPIVFKGPTLDVQFRW
eukprot:Hpha_TRINITY_DN6100_c0_g1::TRINITY_DN6100_c0_g1_i1::g.164876::m.164876